MCVYRFFFWVFGFLDPELDRSLLLLSESRPRFFAVCSAAFFSSRLTLGALPRSFFFLAGSSSLSLSDCFALAFPLFLSLPLLFFAEFASSPSERF